MNGYKDYYILEFIAGINFGKVYKAKDLINGKLVAWKRIKKNSKILSREYLILEKLKNKSYIIQLYDIFYSQNCENIFIQNLIFEYYPMNLEILLNNLKSGKIKKFPLDIIKKLIKKILIGISEMHSLGICHRDLKPDNIMLDSDFNPYIADFGSSKILSNFNTPHVVSTYYRAPELILGMSNYNKEIDIWSFGIIIIELLTLKIPFVGHNEGTQLIQIFKNLGNPAENIWKKFEKNLEGNGDILKFLKNLKINFDFFGILLKDFDIKTTKEVKDLLKKCLDYDYKNRIKSDELLKHKFFDFELLN